MSIFAKSVAVPLPRAIWTRLPLRTLRPPFRAATFVTQAAANQHASPQRPHEQQPTSIVPCQSFKKKKIVPCKKGTLYGESKCRPPASGCKRLATRAKQGYYRINTRAQSYLIRVNEEKYKIKQFRYGGSTVGMPGNKAQTTKARLIV